MLESARTTCDQVREQLKAAQYVQVYLIIRHAHCAHSILTVLKGNPSSQEKTGNANCWNPTSCHCQPMRVESLIDVKPSQPETYISSRLVVRQLDMIEFAQGDDHSAIITGEPGVL